jgi:serine/threonine-protein kinase
MSTNSHDSDRNLLFGILALQVNFIGRDDLVKAMHAWVLSKHKPLGAILHEQGKLTADQLHALDALIEQHLKLHADSSSRSLQALSALPEVQSTLATIQDQDVQASLAHFGSKSSVTQSHFPAPPPKSTGVRYLKLRPHVDGGLGKVFVAEDTELHREVALKEIRPEHADNPNSRGRFLMEAEITGGLEHPGIVPVYGLGAYPNGQPYYAMRFIHGDTLKSAIDAFHAAESPHRDHGERTLAFRQLLTRFVDVCNAVAYAHSRGVLHRDLKPANIMLGKFGETLVVDWGLAKPGVKQRNRAGKTAEIEEDRTLIPASGSSIDETQPGALLGTLPYMSPEQAAGNLGDLGPSSDIFSLGTMLYVLLTGKKPFAATEKDVLLAQVCRGVFDPPGLAKPHTPPALDAICRKAMAFDPKNRYASALALAQDVEHWLADEPVRAFREPWTVRAGRLARRHKTALVAAVVLLVTAVIALAGSTAAVLAEQRQTEKQRQIAETNYQMSRRQCDNMIRLIETSEPEMASAPHLFDCRRDLLLTSAQACRQSREQEPDDVELQKRTATIYRYAANFLRMTNETNEAEPLLQESIKLREAFARQDPEQELLLSDTLRDYAHLQIKQGRLPEALAKLNLAQQIVERLQEKSNTAVFRRRLGLILLNTASVEYRQGKPEQPRVLEKIDQSVSLFRQLVDGKKGEVNPYDPVMLAATLNWKAIVEREGGDLAAANKSHIETIKLIMAVQSKKSRSVNEADVQHFMAELQIEHCKTLFKLNQGATAENNMGVAINKLIELSQQYKQMPGYEEALAIAVRERGELRLQMENYAGARDHFKSAYKVLVRLTGKYGHLPGPHAELGKTCVGLGQVAARLNDENPVPWFKQGVTCLQESLRLSPDNAQLEQALKTAKNLAESNGH